MKLSQSATLFLLLVFVTKAFAHSPYTYSLSSGYDVLFYDLEIKLDAKLQRIAGRNRITFHTDRVLESLTLSLAGNMQAARVLYLGRPQTFNQKDGKLEVKFAQPLKKSITTTVEVFFAGNPLSTRSENPIWATGERGRDLISLSPDMLAPEQWWPINPDPEDLADSMALSVIFDRDAEVVASGQFRQKNNLPGNFSQWEFKHPGKIGPQNVSIHIGDFVLVTDVYNNRSGSHQMQAWVTRAHQARAREYLYELKGMIGFMEKYFGIYPYWKEGYRITEGNSGHQLAPVEENSVQGESGFIENGDRYLLRQVAYDWFERPLKIAETKDAWIYEALYTYAEFLFFEEYFNAERAKVYMSSEREHIQDVPLIHNVTLTPSLNRQIGLKGAWLLHTLRRVVDNDVKWFETLRSLSVDFRNKPLTTQEFYEYLSWKLGEDYVYIFRQYLVHPNLPVFVYRIQKKGKKFNLYYRWETDVPEFDLPVDMQTLSGVERLKPTNEWQTFFRKGMSEKQVFFDTGAGLYEIRKESD
ncbi:MAG: hypothetical protein SF052_26270 [Bacteroidia bacterium]|nr:hypothetical protein [Bacteroidia bacterium]